MLAYQWISMELGNYQSYLLRPIHKEDQIELTIVSNPAMPGEEEMIAFSNVNELIVGVKAFIDDLMQETMTSVVKEFPITCYLPCPKCAVLHVKMEKVMQTSSVFCTKINSFVEMTIHHTMLTTFSKY